MIENPSDTASPIKSLYAEASEYAKNKKDLWKLQAIDKGSEAISGIIEKVALFFIAILFIILLNIALGLWIGSLIGSYYGGFFIMAGLYLLIGFILHIFRDKIIKAPIASALIKKFLN